MWYKNAMEKRILSEQTIQLTKELSIIVIIMLLLLLCNYYISKCS